MFARFKAAFTKPHAAVMPSKDYLEGWTAAERACSVIIATSRTPDEALGETPERSRNPLSRRMRMDEKQI